MRNFIDSAHLTYLGGYFLAVNVLAEKPLIVSKMKKRLTICHEFEIEPVFTSFSSFL